MNFFNSNFYYNSLLVNQAFKRYDIQETTFPELEYVYDNDVFWRQLWKNIDEAKHYVWMLTFIYDNSYSASHTLRKLIEAQKRGAKVCLMIDDVNNRADKALKAELIASGAQVYSLNEILPYFKSLHFSREMFRRHHEKVFIADDVAIVGSANITDEYSSVVYGNYDYMDLNIIMKNLCLSQIRNFFKEIADHYKYQLVKDVSNEEVIRRYNALFKESMFNIPKIRVLKAHPPHIGEIQNFVIHQMSEAKESIKIIQPYYYPIKRFEKVLVKALERGVKVELITAGKRHSSVYAPLKNSILLNDLLKHGLQVYEIHDKLLHMKMYQFDDKLYTAGSFNNDRWSWYIDNEFNVVAQGEEAVGRMTDVFQAMKDISKPIDPDMSIGFTRYVKIKFWENFLMVSEWLSNKRRAFKAEKQIEEHKEFLQALREKDFEKIERMKNKRIGVRERLFKDPAQS